MGPGELSGVSEIEIANDYLYALSTIGRRMHIFSIEGDFKKSVILPGALSQLRVDHFKNIYGILYLGQTYEMVEFDKNIQNKKTYNSRKWEEPRLFQALMTFDLSINGDIIVGNPSDYEYYIYNPRENEKKLIKKLHKPIRIPELDIERYKTSGWKIPEYYEAYYRIYADDNGKIIVNTRTSLNGQAKNFYDLFENDGKYLSSFAIDAYKNLIWKRDHLYAIDEDKEGNQIVRVFKIRWKENTQ
jgi:hypothetical protein